MQSIFSTLFGRWQQRCGLLLAVLQQLVDTSRIVFGRVYVMIRCPYIRPSHLAPQPRHVAGLLLWAQGHEISIESGSCPAAAAAPQYSAQQQM